jgi:hypothetical protein
MKNLATPKTSMMKDIIEDIKASSKKIYDLCYSEMTEHRQTGGFGQNYNQICR